MEAVHEDMRVQKLRVREKSQTRTGVAHRVTVGGEIAATKARPSLPTWVEAPAP